MPERKMAVVGASQVEAIRLWKSFRISIRSSEPEFDQLSLADVFAT